MKNKNFNSLVSSYKKHWAQGDLQAAYAGLMKYVQSLKTQFAKVLGKEYTIGNIFPGNMDITYFYVVNDYLKSHKLNLGLVLNHEKMTFEMWVFGQTKDVQEQYWHLFQNTRWATGTTVPKYSVVEVVLIENPDFNNLDQLSKKVIIKFSIASEEIMVSLRDIRLENANT